MRSAFVSLAFLCGMALPPPATGACIGASGPLTMPLVELYTAAACDACRPAERWLADLGGERVTAITLHMDLVDYGAPEARVRQRVDRRQYGLARARRVIVTTPRVLVQGQPADWSRLETVEALRREMRRPELAHIAITLEPRDPGSLDASIRVEAVAGAGARLWYAGFRSRRPELASDGAAAEESAILQWVGPIEIPAEGRLSHAARVALPPGLPTAPTGVVAFVESGASARVGQSLVVPLCRNAGVR